MEGCWFYPTGRIRPILKSLIYHLTELKKTVLDKLYKAHMPKQRKQQRDVRRERRKR